MKINKYHPMGDIYLFKMLILLIKMHIYVLNQKNKDRTIMKTLENSRNKRKQ